MGCNNKSGEPVPNFNQDDDVLRKLLKCPSLTSEE